ncbi:MAG: hypothetical protein NVSMB51_12630 [Solirubrobacteraceae bacterium]
MVRGILTGWVALLLSFASSAMASPLLAPGPPAGIAYGQAAAIGGSQAAPGALLELQAAPYPALRFASVAHATAAADGSFAFPPQKPDRNTRYRVLSPDGTTSPSLDLFVSAPSLQRVIAQRDGRVQVTLLSYHARSLDWGHVNVSWFAAKAGSHRFDLLATSRTRELRAGVTYATAYFFPPLGRFSYRACFNPPGEAAMGPPALHTRCPRGSFVAR